jgi:hypothetical protein
VHITDPNAAEAECLAALDRWSTDLNSSCDAFAARQFPPRTVVEMDAWLASFSDAQRQLDWYRAMGDRLARQGYPHLSTRVAGISQDMASALEIYRGMRASAAQFATQLSAINASAADHTLKTIQDANRRRQDAFEQIMQRWQNR